MDHNRNERVMSLLDSFLEGRKNELSDVQDLETASSDYVSAYLDTSSDIPESAADKTIRSKTEQLLDAFLSSRHERLSIEPLLPQDAAYGEQQDVDDADDKSNTLDDMYYTETLAQIYLKQHRYDKALEIIRSLYLNFPNKSIYFADQIRYLEKLIRINQKNTIENV